MTHPRPIQGPTSGVANLSEVDLGSIYQYIQGRLPQPKSSAVVAAMSLPSTTADGTPTVLTDSLTAPTYWWTLTYNAAVSAWLFTGGAAASTEVATSETTSSATYTDLATVGPSFTAPADGSYLISFGALLVGNAAGASTVRAGFVAAKLGSAAAADAESAAFSDNRTAADTDAQTVARTLVRSLSAADVVELQYRSGSAASQLAASRRWLSVTPVALTA